MLWRTNAIGGEDDFVFHPRLFENRNIVVTGASRGIGLEVARQFLDCGARVLVHTGRGKDRDLPDFLLMAESERRALLVPGDFSVSGGAAAFAEKVLGFFESVHGLVNNAGIVDQTARVDEMSVERIERMMRINVTGSMLCAGEAIRRMSTRHGGQGGAIVNISSMAAILGAPGQYVDYAASKAAIDIFTIGLSREVATEGVRVNAVRPGVIDTDIHASGGLPDRARDIAPTIPMKRPGKPEEIADSVLYLLSPAASYITGAILNVSGGR